jgi:eukaryotic-like serine/threonine-protein kinase
MGVVYNSEAAGRKPEGKGPSRRIYRFGIFELRAETGELSKNGIRIKLQTRPCQVLEALLERPGELVTREELCARLWPSGTFVDFESGLNTATNRLRAALGDSAETPRYIETLPRLGYRFICPVTEVDASGTETHHPFETVSPQPASHKETAPPADADQPDGTLRAGAGNTRLERFRAPVIAIAAILAGIAIAFAYFGWESGAHGTQPNLQQLTFRSGEIGSARFTADSKSVVYSAHWEDGESRLYLVHLSDTAPQVLNVPEGRLTAVSPSGDIAIIASDPAHPNQSFRLMRFSQKGSAPEVLGEEVRSADWLPGGSELAIVKQHGTESVVEFPTGKPLYRTQGWIDSLRVAPCGDLVAFIEHSIHDDSAGYVRILSRSGVTRPLTGQWNNVEGLAWSPSGNEIWFTASMNGARASLWAVSEGGKVREISDTPSSLRLLDISRRGTVLVAADDGRTIMRARFGQDESEGDLSKFDATHADDISPDGRLVLFTEAGDAGGSHYAAFLYDRVTHSTSQVASGRALAISPDEKWILTIDAKDRSQLMLTAIATETHKPIPRSGLMYQWARFLPSGNELLVGGAYAGKPLQIYRQSVGDGKPTPIQTLPYLDYVAVSPNGQRIAGIDSSFEMEAFDIGGKRLGGFTEAFPVGWSKTGELYSLVHEHSSFIIIKMNVVTGEKGTWRTISAGDTPGFSGLAGIVAAPDVDSYVYSSHLRSSRLYLVNGWS